MNSFNYNELFLNLGNPAFLQFTSHLSAAKSNIKINSIFPYMYNKPFGLQLCTSNKCHQSSLSIAKARHCVGSKNVQDRAFHNVIRGTKGRIFQKLLTQVLSSKFDPYPNLNSFDNTFSYVAIYMHLTVEKGKVFVIFQERSQRFDQFQAWLTLVFTNCTHDQYVLTSLTLSSQAFQLIPRTYNLLEAVE